MVLLIDAGASSTELALLDEGAVLLKSTQTGLNFIHLDFENLGKTISSIAADLVDYQHRILQIRFFAAGFKKALHEKNLLNNLNSLFPKADIHLDTDLKAAAIASCGYHPGIVAILGTGSSIAYYDGKDIVASIKSGGYLFGDEGSGFHIGKELVKHYISGDLQEDLSKAFEATYGLTADELMQDIYQAKNIKSEVASYSTFISQHIDSPEMEKLVKSCFSTFVEKAKRLSIYSKEINFVGSIAFHFKKQLKEVFSGENLEIRSIIQKPIDSLVNHYLHKK